MSKEFKREVRYIVIKLKDINQNTQRQLHNFMQDLEIPSRDCVVVESDWPEYEPVWKMIEARMTGKALASREGESSPQAAVPELMKMEPYQTIDKSSKNYKAGWNACRAAILAHKERTE